MQFFLLNENYQAINQYSLGSIMQFSDGVDIVFCGIQGASETAPTDQIAQLIGTPNGATTPVETINLTWGSFTFRGATIYGWKTASGLPARFTQVAGPLTLNLVVSTGESVLYSTNVVVNVNESSSESAWLENINYAQWEELVSYFAAVAPGVSTPTLDGDNEWNGSNTFNKEVKGVSPTSTNGLTTKEYVDNQDISYLGTATATAKTYTDEKLANYAKSEDVANTYATKSEVATGDSDTLASAKSYVDNKGFAVQGLDNEFSTTGNTFNKMITLKDSDTNSTERVNYDGTFDIYVNSAHKGTSHLPQGESTDYYLVYSKSESKNIDDYATKAELDSYAKSSALTSYVDKTSDETIGGTKTFSSPIKADEIDNSNGNAMIRYKSSESTTPIVVGSSEKPLTIMGSGDRPNYSKDGSDFSGSPLALLSDVGSAANSVTLDTAQTITGQKTFSAKTFFNNYIALNSSYPIVCKDDSVSALSASSSGNYYGNLSKPSYFNSKYKYERVTNADSRPLYRLTVPFDYSSTTKYTTIFKQTTTTGVSPSYTWARIYGEVKFPSNIMCHFDISFYPYATSSSYPLYNIMGTATSTTTASILDYADYAFLRFAYNSGLEVQFIQNSKILKGYVVVETSDCGQNINYPINMITPSNIENYISTSASGKQIATSTTLYRNYRIIDNFSLITNSNISSKVKSYCYNFKLVYVTQGDCYSTNANETQVASGTAGSYGSIIVATAQENAQCGWLNIYDGSQSFSFTSNSGDNGFWGSARLNGTAIIPAGASWRITSEKTNYGRYAVYNLERY